MGLPRKLKEALKLAVIEEEIRLSMDSLDDQVDSILMRFESDCILGLEDSGDISTTVGESYYSLRRLIEAPEDDEDKPEDDESKSKDEPKDDKEKDDEDIKDKVGDQDDQVPDEESDPLKPKIDLGKFAGKVSRLVSNYEHLLNLPMAIANRAANYLNQNYGEAVAKEFSDIMERDFEVEMKPPVGAEPREKPIAVGAAASGIGGG